MIVQKARTRHRGFRRGLFSFALLIVVLGNGPLHADSATPVVATPVAAASLSRSIKLAGTVTAVKDAQLSTSVSGLAEELMVREGSAVKRGDVLLQLDDELARLSLRRARAEEERGELLMNDATRRLTEAKQLLQDNHIPESALKDIEAEWAAASASFSAASNAARIEAAKLARHTLKAPFDGVVAGKSVERGEWVTPGQPVFQLVSNTDLQLDFELPQSAFGRVDVGSVVRYTSALQPGVIRNASVTDIVPVANPQSRTYLLRARLSPEAAGRLSAGTSINGDVDISSPGAALRVPRDAVQRQSNGDSVVWTVHEDGTVASGPDDKANTEMMTARKNLVTTGAAGNGFIEVLSGITSNALVVVRGNEALRDGQKVAVSLQ